VSIGAFQAQIGFHPPTQFLTMVLLDAASGTLCGCLTVDSLYPNHSHQ
jgi:hypothetical protein